MHVDQFGAGVVGEVHQVGEVGVEVLLLLVGVPLLEGEFPQLVGDSQPRV